MSATSPNSVVVSEHHAIVGARAEEAAMRLLAERLPLLVWSTDRDLHVQWGVKTPSLSGPEAILCKLLETADPESPVIAAHRRALAGETAEFELAWAGRCFQAHVEPLRDASTEVIGTVAMALDAGRRRCRRRALGGRKRDGLLDLARYDALTRLPNRALFVERLRRAVAAEWCEEGLFILLFDLDRFKEVNAGLGFEAGDRLLVEVSERLARRLRPTDTLARYGADEFALLLTRVRTAFDAAQVADRMRRALSAPLILQDREMTPAVSVGLAAGAAGERPEQIMRDADRALARAKALGKPIDHAFEETLDSRSRSLLEMESALHRLLERPEFNHYQPVVSRKEGKVAGFDILLWRRSAQSGGPRLQG